MTLRLEWTDTARRESRKLDPQVNRRVTAALRRFADTQQGDILKLAGVEPPEYRLRVGDWRVRFSWDHTAAVITVLHVFPRGQGYR